MMVTHWSHHVTRIDASHSDEGCKMLLLLHAARVHVYEHTAHRHVGIDWMNAYAHLCANKAAAASCSLHHCAMHLCVSRDATNGLPSYTAIYFDFKSHLNDTQRNSAQVHVHGKLLIDS